MAFGRLESLLTFSVLALAAQLVTPSLTAWHNRPQPGYQVATVLGAYPCLLYLPKEYRASESSWPLLVYLHGAGERGSDVDFLRLRGLPAHIDQGLDFPAIVVSPQCPLGESWSPGELLSLIEAVERQFRVGRVTVTGYSMGGFGAWALAKAAPGKIEAIAPLCGGGNEADAKNLKNVPVWAFHGAKDKVVPLSSSQRMVEAVQQVGGEAKLTIFPDAGHDITSLVYGEGEVYDWLMTPRAAR